MAAGERGRMRLGGQRVQQVGAHPRGRYSPKALDPAVDAAFPGPQGARVEVLLRDGRRIVQHQLDRRGDPELTLGDRDLDAKFLELAAPVIGTLAGNAQLVGIPSVGKSTPLPCDATGHRRRRSCRVSGATGLSDRLGAVATDGCCRSASRRACSITGIG